MTVVDASVLVDAFLDEGPHGARVRDAIASAGPLRAPELVDVEVLSAWRRLVHQGLATELRVRGAHHELAVLPLDRHTHRPLLRRMWALRDTLSTYDAAYVALAERVGEPLLTGDQRLARAPGIRCRVVVV